VLQFSSLLNEISLIIRKTEHESQSKLKNIEHVLRVFMLNWITSQENNITKQHKIGNELITPKFHLCFLDQFYEMRFAP